MEGDEGAVLGRGYSHLSYITTVEVRLLQMTKVDRQ